MSGAILGWGVDLGHEDSVAARLFENWEEGEYGWAIYCYGPSHTYAALMLERSVVSREIEDPDFSISDFLSVTLGTNGYPVLKSQPTDDELLDLKDIAMEVRPDAGVVELALQPLLLPAD